MATGEGGGRGGKESGDSEDEWWRKWKVNVKQLRSMLVSQDPGRDADLHQLLEECFSLYSSPPDATPSSKEDAVHSVSSDRRYSPLEVAFMWLGGWRPTSAILLVFSLKAVEMGNEVERARPVNSQLFLPALLLSDRQEERMDILQRHTRQAEAELTDRLAMLQMLVADQQMMSALPGPSEPSTSNSSRHGNSLRVRKVLEANVESLRGLTIQAERLRLQTLQELVALLTPVQAARGTVAAFELAFALRTLGRSPLARHPPGATSIPVQLTGDPASTSRTQAGGSDSTGEECNDDGNEQEQPTTMQSFGDGPSQLSVHVLSITHPDSDATDGAQRNNTGDGDSARHAHLEQSNSTAVPARADPGAEISILKLQLSAPPYIDSAAGPDIFVPTSQEVFDEHEQLDDGGDRRELQATDLVHPNDLDTTSSEEATLGQTSTDAQQSGNADSAIEDAVAQPSTQTLDNDQHCVLTFSGK